MNFSHRYDRNSIISEEAQRILGGKKVAVTGLGGLGGFAVEELARFGAGHILGFDFDVFSETNLNRQLFCSEMNLGLLKADETAKRVKMINSDIHFEPFSDKLDENGLKRALSGVDAVLDCLDSVKDRLVLERICEELGTVMIHGAIEGWTGQVSTVYPGDRTLEKIYSCEGACSNDYGNTVFTAAVIASLQVSECIKHLTGKGCTLRHKLLTVDLYNNEFERVLL